MPVNHGNSEPSNKSSTAFDEETVTIDRRNIPKPSPVKRASWTSWASSARESWASEEEPARAQLDSNSPRNDTDERNARLGAIWSARGFILGFALAVSVLTYVACLIIPGTFQSTSDIRVSLSGQSGAASQDSVRASNDLASQYAQAVATSAVVGPAAQQTAVDPNTLLANTSGETVSGQNIIRVSVQSSNSAEAQTMAGAVTESTLAFIRQQSLTQATAYQSAVTDQLRPIDQQIAQATRDVAAASGAAGGGDLVAAQSRLNTLVDRRATISGQAALQSASLIPQVDPLGPPTSAVQVAPRNGLYSLIAAIVGLFVAAQLVLLRARLRA